MFLTLVVSGAPLTRRTADVVAATTAAGWATSVIGTPSARNWLDPGPAVPVAFDFRRPDEPKTRPDPDTLVVCPATFNLVGRIAAAAADTYALAAVAEALGLGVPVVVVPMVGRKLWGHPAWPGQLDTLRRWGVRLLDPSTGTVGPQPQPAEGDAVADAFDPAWVVRALR
jgi:hypothetical protein